MLLTVIALVVWFPTISFPLSDTQNLIVRFLDVGQGDSIHVITPDGHEVLIDGGSSAAVLRELSQGRSFFDRNIDMLVATHPDKDHIGGLVYVMNRYEVGWIVETEVKNDTSVVGAYNYATEYEKARTIIAQADQVIQIGEFVELRILSPLGDTTNWNSNSASIVLQIVYGDIEFMLTGDAPASIEEYLVSKYGKGLESEVLKLGHHGSKTSTAINFLDVVEPEFAVVSASGDNRYGHPHQEVIDRVEGQGIEIVSTAESGTITFVSNGVKVWRE